MSDQEATAGFRNAGWAMSGLPAGIQVAVHPLATTDKASVTGILYGQPGSKLVFCLMHPREFLASHYLVPSLCAAGFSVWTQTSRSPGQDLRLEHELAAIDAAAGLAFLHGAGFERIVLIGNSGGASLYGLYNQQSLRAPQDRLDDSSGGRPVRLRETVMPVADGIVLLAPHPGQGQLLLRCIDPAVVDESDPLVTASDLDFLEPANGYGDPPGGARYDAAFVRRFRDAQHARVERLDRTARESIAERMAMRAKVRNGEPGCDRRAAAFSGIMTVWRTDADLRCWDLSLDPSDRPIGSVWGRDPFVSNYGIPGFGRLCSPEAWLSTWSGISSRANLFETAASLEQPTLQIEYSGDSSVFPSDAEAIFAAVASGAKQRYRFPGDHHGRALAPGEMAGRDMAASAIIEWARELFG